MKKTIIVILVFVSLKCFCQETSYLKKSVNTVQIGTVGLWVNNETKIDKALALRTEIGLFSEIFQEVGYYIAPEISLEPRFYYNIEKRAKNKRDINNNAANFFTIKLNYRSNLFEVSNFRSKTADVSYAIIPKWGIRRNLGSKFNYELGVGLGYFEFLQTRNNVSSFDEGLHFELHMRIGLNL
ncbi:hypothetical protein [Polaribacter sargassicola]|uniref:hypothetical protein n=1 Tax=Polaribacter sargassicola TaxID=2836891 RepID=UPI001F26E2E7|nr:hypothetical protein [Polaribacter sp. DS7-9]MCG1036217.1 hypothetical protein [Polaribacter sp. DS7-9]